MDDGVCAFTSDRVRDFVNLEVFEKYPNLVLCMEVAGPAYEKVSNP